MGLQDRTHTYHPSGASRTTSRSFLSSRKTMIPGHAIFYRASVDSIAAREVPLTSWA